MTARVLPFRRPDPAPQKRLNLRDICTGHCDGCGKEWTMPVPTDFVACPRCHSVGVSIVPGSIRRENAVRVN